MKRIIFVFLFVGSSLLAAREESASDIDAVLSSAASLEIKTAALAADSESEIARLKSVRDSYRRMCSELEKKLADLNKDNAKTSEILSSIGTRLSEDSKAFKSLGEWIDATCKKLESDATASPILSRLKISFDYSAPIETRYALLLSAMRALIEEDGRILRSGETVESGLWVKIRAKSDSDIPFGEVLRNKPPLELEAKK